MVKKFFKKQSKRMPCHKKYKIEKKVREHNKKLKKAEKKKIKIAKRYKMKKDPGIPNRCPFKEQVLKEAQAFRNEKPLDPEVKKKLDEAALREAKKDKLIKTKMTLEEIIKEAEERKEEYERKNGIHSIPDIKATYSDSALKAYYKEFKKVITESDVVLQVLDARDPLGTRCSEVESEVTKSAGKRMVLVINKVDLVPKDNLKSWLSYLRREYPTVAFKASTQTQGSRLGQMKMHILKSTPGQLQGSQCLGAGALLDLLGNYCRNKEIKTSIRVGVVGLPNVGKSSLINSLKRSKACNVGSVPGITKCAQEVQLDSHVKLLDSPGVVFASGSASDASIALKNAFRIDSLSDIMTPASAILQRISRDQLMFHYNIPKFETSDQFFSLLARSMGRLKKHGIPNSDVAARKLLQDWTSGRIKYYTIPPEENVTHVNAEIVQQMATEFNIAALERRENYDIMDSLPDGDGGKGIIVESDAVLREVNETEMDELDSEDDKGKEDGPKGTLLPENVSIAPPSLSKKLKRKLRVTGNKKIDQPRFKTMKMLRKLEVKKNMKLQNRTVRKVDDLADGLEEAMSIF